MAYKNQSQTKQPIVATASPEYGLLIGPKGTTWGRAGIQCKATKWTYLFTKDDEGVVNLMNVLEYVHDEGSHDEWIATQEGVEEFLKQYAEWKAKQAA